MASDTVLTGDLAFLNLADLLQMLGSNGSSGILRLRSPHSAEPGLAYFDSGNPVHAICADKRGIDALYALFGWVEGEFSFSRETFKANQTIKQSRMQIILDGLRMLDDGDLPRMGPAASGPASKDHSAAFSVLRGPLVDYMTVVDEEQFTAGQQIVVEGSHGNWIWVILEGQVDLFRESTKGPLKILSLGEGAFVGSLAAFTIHGHIRNATCVATTNVVLGVLDLQRLSIEYTRMSHEMRTIGLSLDRRLKQLTDRIVDGRQGTADIKAFVEGLKPVIQQGDGKDEGLYQITQGRAAVVRQKGKQVFALAHLATGDVFGRIPFADIGHEPYAAMVLGDESLQFSRLDEAARQNEFERLSPTFKNLFANMVTAVSVTTMLAVRACGRTAADPAKE